MDIDFAGNKVDIMLEKKGDKYYFYYSVNDAAYVKLWEQEISLYDQSLSIFSGKHVTNQNTLFKYFNISRY